MAVARFAGLSAFLLLAGCSSIPFMDGGAPRTACADAEFTIYFTPDSEALPETAAPILQQTHAAVEACRAQGGRLVRAGIHAYPDRGETGAAADRAALARAETVVAALVEAGLPGDRVVAFNHNTTADDPNQVMRRRADIRLEMR